MVQALGAAISGVSVSATRVAVAAHDVANVNTAEFVQRDLLQSERKPAGVEVASIRANGSPAPGYSSSDLAIESVEQIQGSAGYMANLRTISVQDQMLGSLLDITG